MTYEDRPHNPNRGGISRSGNATGFNLTDRHPTDRRFDWLDALLWLVIGMGIIAIGCAVTVWA